MADEVLLNLQSAVILQQQIDGLLHGHQSFSTEYCSILVSQFEQAQQQLQAHFLKLDDPELTNQEILERKISFQQSLVTTYQRLFSSSQKQLFSLVSALPPIKAPINVTSQPQETDNFQEKETASESVNSEWGTVVNSGWTKATAGGCMNYPTWRDNNQILLNVQKAGNITITLSQKPAEDQEPEGVGFYVLPGNKFKKVVVPGDAIAKSSFTRAESVSCTVSLEPSIDGYIILPCTFYAGHILDYSVSIETEGDAEAQIRLAEKRDTCTSVTKSSEWRGKSAGGCRNFPSWVYNPHFYFSCSRPTNAHIIITQNEVDEFDAIGMYVFKATEGKSKSMLKEVLYKSSFSGDKESSLSFAIDCDVIVVPCTFHAEKEANFQITAYADDADVEFEELTDQKEVSVSGEWNEESAGGSTTYSSWRNNPQYAIRLPAASDVSIRLVQKSVNPQNEDKFHPIGMYVFSDTGKRRLLVKPTDVIASTPCSALEAIDLKLTADQFVKQSDNQYSLVIMPCTYYPDLQAQFTLSAFVSGDTLPTIEAYDAFYSVKKSGRWSETSAGGCLNNGATWRNNPQYQFTANKDAKVILLLNVPQQSEKFSIGFYITHVDRPGRKVYTINEKTIVKKAPFRKSSEALTPFSIKAGATYNIIPCTFLPGVISDFTFTVFCNEPDAAALSEVEDQAEPLVIQSKWAGENAGGCLNNNSWWMNPSFALSVKEQDVEATIVLIQQSAAIRGGNQVAVKAIGFSIARSDTNNQPLINSPADLIANVSYEPAIDVSTTVTLAPSETPYIITPSTYYAGEESEFQVLVYTAKKYSDDIIFTALPLPSLNAHVTESITEAELMALMGESYTENQPESEVQTPSEEQQPEEPVVVPEVIKEEVAEPIPVVVEDVSPVVLQEPVIIESEPEIIVTETIIPEAAQATGPPPPPPVSGAPPPPPAVVSKPLVRATTTGVTAAKKPTSTADLMEQIQQKKFLRTVSENEKSNYMQRRQNEIFAGFNMQIISRRTAIECSDEEEEEFSDHEDEDDWW